MELVAILENPVPHRVSNVPSPASLWANGVAENPRVRFLLRYAPL